MQEHSVPLPATQAESFTARYFGGFQSDYPAEMQTTAQIRLHNLHLLLEECERDSGSRGAAALLSRKTTVPAPFISQLLHAVPNKSGAVRTIGDETARKLESGMRKPKGWMDQDHALARNVEEAALLDLIRALTPAQLNTIVGTAEQFVDLNAASMETPMPRPPGKPAPRARGH